MRRGLAASGENKAIEKREKGSSEMARIVETTNKYTLNVGTNANELGSLLGEAKTDWKRLGIDVLLRAAIAALALWVWNNKGGLSGVIGMILILILAVLVLYPLLHAGDSMQFFENGVKFKNKAYLFRSQQVEWMRREGYLNVMEGRYLYLNGNKDKINASYVQNPQDAFASAYQKLGLNG